MSRPYTSLEVFKRNSLKTVAAKGECNRYAISVSDLCFVKKCPLCNSYKTLLIAEVYLRARLKFFATSVCTECAFTFRSVSPSFNWFKKCWAKIATKELKVFNDNTEAVRKERYKEYYEVLSGYIKKGTVLDIGAAYGIGSQLFKDYGYTVEAVEPEFNKANYIKNFYRIPVVGERIETLNKKENYDIIIFAGCLEHLDDPVCAIRSAKRLLKPKGVMFLEVPIIWGFVIWSDALFLTHKSNFTKENIISLVTQNGLEIIEFVDIPIRPDYQCEFGCVVRVADFLKLPSSNIVQKRQVVDEALIKKIKKLYRKNFPLKKIARSEGVLRYNVPYIDHFFQTLRLENKVISEPKNKNDFISFRESS